MFKRFLDLLHVKTYISQSEEEPAEDSTTELIKRLYEDLDDTEIQVLIGTDIVSFSSEFLKVIDEKREKMAKETGFVFPVIRITEDDSLQENQLRLLIKDKFVTERYLLCNSKGIKEEFSSLLDYMFHNCLDEIFSYKMLENYLYRINTENYCLFAKLLNYYELKDLKEIFLNILKEGKSVRKLSHVFSTIYDVAVECGTYRRLNVDLVSKNVLEKI